MSGRSAQARPILVFYHIPGDGDEAEMPNAFPVLKPEGQVMLQDVRSKFPLPGTYHFRFKMRWGPDPLQVAWMDVTNEAAQVPFFDGKVVAKAVRRHQEELGGADLNTFPFFCCVPVFAQRWRVRCRFWDVDRFG
ncbi:unnamed protein product [Durusdinium trenchii]|uniref:DIX domain-containing protein n=1 Tax=Durusdinium trenchii TaxID=1381693 RepID=A0ABP0PBN2_9DINO